MDATSPYAYWQAVLAGETPPKTDTVKDPETGFDVPAAQPGFWRSPLKDGRYIPLAIWPGDDGALVYQLGSGSVMPVTPDFTERTFARALPVAYEEYVEVMGGAPWRDVDPAVHQSPAGPQLSNEPVDPAESFADQIEAAMRSLEGYGEAVADDETAARAQSLRARLLELSGDADKRREEEKAPHFKAAKAVDARWQPLVKRAKAGADKLRQLLNAYATKRMREEEAAKAKEDIHTASAEEKEPERQLGAVKPGVSSRNIKGGYGRAASVTKVKQIKVTDWPALATALCKEPSVMTELKRIAQNRVNRGEDAPPGVEVEEVATVR